MNEIAIDADLIEGLDTTMEIGICPLRDTVVYPQMPQLLTATRIHSIRATEAAIAKDGLVGLFAQRDPETEEPGVDDLYHVGTLGKVHREWRLPDGSLRLIIQGLARISLDEMLGRRPYITARVSKLEETGDLQSTDIQAMSRNVAEQFDAIVKMTSHLPDELQIMVVNINHAGRMADFVAANLNLQLEEHQRVLELVEMDKRLQYLTELLAREVEILQVGTRIQSQVQEKMDKSQREFFLREQLKHIQQELNGSDPQTADLEELQGKIEAAAMPEEAREAAERELGRLEQMMPGAPEYSVSRTYLDWLVELPWAISTEDHLDLKQAGRILEEDHYGLDKVKERILEYLAVRRLRQEMKGPILCFVGPPGVGKTSLGRSIARALGREFCRISLGGVHDEAEIRGHRRTYIGSLPGRIIQGLRKAGSNNPVFMLDEIDKVGADFRGDPAAALLEVLDPEQNFSFSDHYLDVPFDLSRVMFITTGNMLEPVPPALRDRMEEIALPGYTQEEKVQIARRHLLPRQMQEHGLETRQLDLKPTAMDRLINDYTREAGLRNLERQLGTICRKVARRYVEGNRRKTLISGKRLEEYLGPALFHSETAGRKAEVGVATGLAATAAGGEILFIEATRMKGDQKLILTGQLGEVMQESAQAALSYMRTHADDLQIDADEFARSDIHLHVPAGAMPKEGPSAGIALATALVSLFTSRPVRADVAITGEITLRGRVLPVGGIRDKVMAAQRSGISTVILPAKNEKDLQDVPAQIRKLMTFELVDLFDDVLAVVLTGTRRRGTGRGQRPGADRHSATKSTPRPRQVRRLSASGCRSLPAESAAGTVRPREE